MAHRVVDQVAHQANQQRSIRHHPRFGHHHGQPLVVVASQLIGHQRSQIQPGREGRPPRTVHTSEVEQLAGQRLQAAHVDQHLACSGRPISAIRIRQRHFQLRARRGQRAAQLVRGICQELTTGGGGVVDSLEQTVHRCGQPIQFGGTRVCRDAFIEPAAGDGCHLPSHAFHRGERSTHDQPDAHRGEQREQRQPHPQPGHQCGDRLLGCPQRRGGIDREGSGRRVDRARDHSVVSAATAADHRPGYRRRRLGTRRRGREHVEPHGCSEAG